MNAATVIGIIIGKAPPGVIRLLSKALKMACRRKHAGKMAGLEEKHKRLENQILSARVDAEKAKAAKPKQMPRWPNFTLMRRRANR